MDTPAPKPLEALTPERLRAVVDVLDEGVVVLDSDGVVVLANRAGTEVLGVPRDRLVGRRLTDLDWGITDADGTPLDRGDHPVLIAARTGEEQPPATLGFVVDAEAEPLWVDVGVRILEGAGTETPSLIVASFRDVSTRIEAEEALRAAGQLKDQIIGMASHELRTPLVSIRGALTFLEPYVKDADQDGQRLYEMAIRNTLLLERLVTGLLDIERLEGGRISLELEAHSLSALLQDAMDVVSAPAEERGVLLHREDAADRSVHVDRDRILQVITNLLSNAVKFSEPGSVVRVQAGASEDGVHIRVHDRGRGIPPDYLDRIFERFGQVDPSDAVERGGVGLGLPIARAIVSKHGGRIWAESTWGQGSTFHLVLPTAASRPA